MSIVTVDTDVEQVLLIRISASDGIKKYINAQILNRNFFNSSIWCRANKKKIPEFDKTMWGWKKDGDGFTPLWMTVDEASKACKELIKCGCKKKCAKRCQCKKSDKSCTELCGCGGGYSLTSD